MTQVIADFAPADAAPVTANAYAEIRRLRGCLEVANRKRRAQRIALRQLNRAHATLWKVVRIQAGEKLEAKGEVNASETG